MKNLDRDKLKAMLSDFVPTAPAEAVDSLVEVLDCAIQEDFDGVTAAVDKLPYPLLNALAFMAGKLSTQVAALAFYAERRLPQITPVATISETPLPAGSKRRPRRSIAPVAGRTSTSRATSRAKRSAKGGTIH